VVSTGGKITTSKFRIKDSSNGREPPCLCSSNNSNASSPSLKYLSQIVSFIERNYDNFQPGCGDDKIRLVLNILDRVSLKGLRRE